MVKMEPNAIHPAAFMNQPVATPHQPRYAQQLPPGGSQEEETISNLQLTYHVVPGTAGRQVGDPYRTCAIQQTALQAMSPLVSAMSVTGRVRAPTYPYKFLAALKKPWFLPCPLPGGSGHQRIGTEFIASLKTSCNGFVAGGRHLCGIICRGRSFSG